MTLKPAKAHVEYLLAGVAFFVSVTTLAVYIYQARMMREQQRVSVWPYVEFTTSNVVDYHLSVRNKGVGPAIIRKVEMRVDGKVVQNNRALVAAVLGPDSKLTYQNSSLEGRVLAPGEEIMPFRVPGFQNSREFDAKLRAHTFDLNITYCSIYGDCWECTSDRVERRPPENLRLY
jgi:hypothetical protein